VLSRENRAHIGRGKSSPLILEYSELIIALGTEEIDSHRSRVRCALDGRRHGDMDEGWNLDQPIEDRRENRAPGGLIITLKCVSSGDASNPCTNADAYLPVAGCGEGKCER
jgi:hypothetical protein